MKDFGNRLKNLRNDKGMLQRELADLLKVSRVTITHYENGKRSPDQATIKKISQLFNVSTDFLLGNSNIKDPYHEDNGMDKYKKDIEAIEKFRSLVIKEGCTEYNDKTLEELVDDIILLNQIKNTDNKNEESN